MYYIYENGRFLSMWYKPDRENWSGFSRALRFATKQEAIQVLKEVTEYLRNSCGVTSFYPSVLRITKEDISE